MTDLKNRPDNRQHVLNTGQCSCHDAQGDEIDCAGSGQDAQWKSGLAWPDPRFLVDGDRVTDALTGLVWPRDANLAEFPFTWDEALAFVADLNSSDYLGYRDWRLPNRRELRSLISHQTRRPALPEDHPFENVFANWYWSSTSSAQHPNHAWYINLDGGRMFYGGKDQGYMVWPVRGRGRGCLLSTGQQYCFDHRGRVIDCAGSGQDAEYAPEMPWPARRFEQTADGILDRLTGLLWTRCADLARGSVSWQQALDTVQALEQQNDGMTWRLPNINELESLVDCARYEPALPADHIFDQVQDIYWSSSSSLYEPDWAWALYLHKGAVGVGQKSFARFHVWAVADAD